jgi:DNA-binding transcriptional LysR family regulator
MMDGMDVRQLEAFRAVIENRSATRAAVALGVTQPAVSAQIARLEEQLGFALFERGRGRLEPTTEAQLLYAEVTQALTGLDRVRQAAVEIRQGQTGRLAVASHPSAAISLLPKVVAEFVRERPGVTIRFISRSSQGVRELIPAQAFDIGIAELPVDTSAAAVERFRVDCVAALPAKHPLAAAKVITPLLLDGAPFVAMFRSHMVFHAVARAFDEAGARWNVCGETEFAATACGLVASGAGIAVVDPFTAADFAGRGVVVRPFKPVVPYEFAVFHPPGREPSLLAKDFVAVLRRRIHPFLKT